MNLILDDFKGKVVDVHTKTKWGCMSGVHTAYVFVDANDENEALSNIPENERQNAKIINVNKFSAKQIADLHKKMEKMDK